MRKVLPCVLTTLAVVAVPLVLAAEETKRPDRPDPAALFQRLDADKDGVITAAEVSDGVPEPIKQMLIRADENKDKKLTAEEFKAAVKRHQAERGRPEGGSAKAPQRAHHQGHREHSRSHADADAGHREHGHGDAEQGKSRHDRDGHAKHGDGRRPGPPEAGPQPPHPDPKMVFAAMDKNGDKQLSLDEFLEGTKRLHQRMAAAHRGGPKPPFAHGPEGHRPPFARGPEGPKPPFARGPEGHRSSFAHRPEGPKPPFARGFEGPKPPCLHGPECPMCRFARGPEGPKPPFVHRPEGHRVPFIHRPGGDEPPFAERAAKFGRELFAKADKNNDGKISLDEVPEERREGFKRLLEKADKDGDKALSGEEAKRVAAFISHRMHSGDRGGPPEEIKQRIEKARQRAGEMKKEVEKRKAEVGKRLEAAKEKDKAEKKDKD